MLRLLLKYIGAMVLSAYITGPALAASGDLLWRFKTDGAIWSDIALRGNIAYFGSDDGHLYALNVHHRAPVWKFKTGGIVRSKTAFHGSGVYITSDDGFLYALHRRDGRLLWKFDLGDGAAPRNLPANHAPWDFDWGKSSPVVSGNQVFVGSATGQVYALDARSGKLAWRFQAADRVRGAPVVADGLVFVASWDKNLYALRRDSGQLQWKQAVGDRLVSTPAVIGDKVIIGARDAVLYAWHTKTGEPAWRHAYQDGSWIESSATAAGDRQSFFIGSSDAAKLSKFSTSTGSELWSFSTTGWTWGTPAVSDGRVYIGSTGATEYQRPLKGGIFAVDEQTGKQLWRHDFTTTTTTGYINSGVHATPAIGLGMVLVGGVDGLLYAFEE